MYIYIRNYIKQLFSVVTNGILAATSNSAFNILKSLAYSTCIIRHNWLPPSWNAFFIWILGPTPASVYFVLHPECAHLCFSLCHGTTFVSLHILQILSPTFRILNIRCIFPNSNYSPELHPELQMWVKFSTFCQLDTIETAQNSNFHTWPGSFYPPTCFYFHVPQFSKTFILRCGGFETCLQGFFVFALFFWHYFHRERYCSCPFLINFGGIVIASVNIVLLKFPYEIFEIGS